MSTSLSIQSEQTPVHPLQTFRSSCDYPVFEATVIRPFIRAARSRANLHAETRLPIEFAPSNPIIADALQFLNETDYNNPTQHSHPPKVNRPAPRPILPLGGYVSKKRPDCFIWESGYFKKYSEVILGDSGRLGRVMGICGLGRNYVMMRINELGNSFHGALRISRMVVSSPPTSAWISLLQSFVARFFKPVLKPMLSYIDEERVGKGSMVDTQDDSSVGFTSSEEIGDLEDSDFADDEGTD